MVDKEKARRAVRLMLEAIGEDPQREGLLETPERVARMYEEIFSGMGSDGKEELSKVFQVETDEMVIEKDIHFYSMCEHHMLPFFGKVHVAYLPDGKVVGLSKLARIVDIYSKRLQLQERMTEQIADAIVKYMDPRGAMVVVEAEHMCMTMRGVKKPGSKTVTAAARGLMKTDPALQQRFFDVIGRM